MEQPNRDCKMEQQKNKTELLTANEINKRLVCMWESGLGSQIINSYSVTTVKVRKTARIRNQNNQVPHLS